MEEEIISKSIGIIYVLSNPSFTEIVKIGYTKNPLEERINELSKSTSIPTPFVCEHHIIVPYVQEVEARIHKHLKEYRINPKREFFRLSVKKAISEINLLLFQEKDSLKADIIQIYKLLNLQKKYPKRFVTMAPNEKEKVINALSRVIEKAENTLINDYGTKSINDKILPDD